MDKVKSPQSRPIRLVVMTLILGIVFLVLLFVLPFGSASYSVWNSSYYGQEHDSKNQEEKDQQQHLSTATASEKQQENELRSIKTNKPAGSSSSLSHGAKENKKNSLQFLSTPSPPADDLPMIPNIKKSIDINAFVKESKDLIDDLHEKILRNLHNLWIRSFDEDERLVKKRVVPGIIIPTFKDGDYLQNLLLAFDTPFRHITFINNAPDKKGDPVIRQIMDTLQPLQDAGAVSVYFHSENAGFSASINIGIRRTRLVLTQTARQHPETWDVAKNPLWYFIINCDSVFKPTAAQTFAVATNDELMLSDAQRLLEHRERNPGNEKKPAKPGLFYTNDVVDHFCFAISEEAVQKAGDMDECFYPAYFEDIDWRWRVHLAGFEDFLTGAPVGHLRSVNLKKSSSKSPFMQMLDRTGRGWEYGRMKWGNVSPKKLRSPFPPSGVIAPFGIKNFPLNLYVVDPVHRNCVLTGNGPKFVGSGSCWYNGSVLLEHLPPGTELPPFLRNPVSRMDEYYRDNSRFRIW
jgi:hypothetical protein